MSASAPTDEVRHLGLGTNVLLEKSCIVHQLDQHPPRIAAETIGKEVI